MTVPDDLLTTPEVKVSEAVKRLIRKERRLRLRDRIAAVVTPTLLLLAWEVVARAGYVDERLFPAPTTILKNLWQMAVDGNLAAHAWATVSRILYGSAIGIIAGVLLGLAMGYYRLLGAAFSHILAALYALPKIAVFPLLLVIFGLGEVPRVLVVAISVFFVMQISTMSGVRHVDPHTIEAGTAFGATGWRRFRFIVVPSVLPSIFSGLRVCAGVSVLVIVAVEFVGSSDGLGFLIWNSWTLFQPTRMYVGLAAVAVLGALLAGIVNLGERWATPWTRGISTRRRRDAMDAN